MTFYEIGPMSFSSKEGVLNKPPEDTWVTAFGFDQLENNQLYWAAVYFTVTTITTVGYGDISSKNTLERIMGIISMILGVIAFSYATGALSSLIQDDDQRKA